MNRGKIVYWISAFALCTIILSTVYVKAQNMGQEQQTANGQDITEIASNDTRLTTLVSALKSAGLVETLKGKGPYTVFAPTDDAFKKLPDGALAELLKPENKSKLVDLLLYHVFPAKVEAKQALKLDGQQITMQNGKKVNISLKDGELYINNAKVIMNDIQAKNGVIHLIDAVLLPKN